jgi:hypothetical protein
MGEEEQAVERLKNFPSNKEFKKDNCVLGSQRN